MRLQYVSLVKTNEKNVYALCRSLTGTHGHENHGEHGDQQNNHQDKQGLVRECAFATRIAAPITTSTREVDSDLSSLASAESKGTK